MFDETLKGNLSMFSVLHLITLLVLVLVFLVIYRFKDKLSKPKNDRIFRITLGFGLLFYLRVDSIYGYYLRVIIHIP